MPTDQPQKAVIYVRVSGTKQIREGDGLASQQARCREYADYKAYEVIHVFADDMSGKHADRPAMEEMLAFLRKHRAINPVVIIDDISRLARGLEAHLKLRASLAKAGARLESPSIEFGDDPDSIMVENLLATVAQHQREKNGQQTHNRMRGRMMNGYWVFRAPPGYRYEKRDGHGKILVPDEPHASMIRKAFESYASGRLETIVEVKRYFEGTDVFRKSPRGEVHPTRIQEMFGRPVYAGYISHASWGLNMIPAKHEPIISLETWQAVQDRNQAVAKAPARKDINADFPLRNFIACADCNQPLTACWSKGRSARYPYYLCDTKGCESYRKSIRRDQLEGDFEELLKEMQPSANLFALAFATFRDLWNDRLALAETLKREQEARIKALDRNLHLFLDRIVETANNSVIAAYEARIGEIETEKALIADRLRNSGKPTSSFEETYRTAFTFLANPWKLWRSPRLEDKRAVLKLVFANRLAYCRNTGYRTAQTTLPFKALEGFQTGKLEMVPPVSIWCTTHNCT